MVLFIGVVYYYIFGVIWFYKIDDNLLFVIFEGELLVGGSCIVVMIMVFIGCEVDGNSWVVNDLFFMFIFMFDNMKYY